MRTISRCCFGFLASLVMAVAWAPAAAQTGALEVTVFDAAGKAPVPGVAVTLRNELQLSATVTVRTGPSGVAVFPVLRAGGGYEIEVAASNHARQSMVGLRVHAGTTTRVAVRLQAELTERVSVSVRREVVDVDKTSTSTKFDEEFIQDLPIMGRLYQNVLTLTAGVNDVRGGGNPNVHGARTTDFKTQVGGVSNQDPLTGEWMSLVNPDSIDEMEVITAGAGVEYGRAQGGFASIIQKQGGNELEGVASFYFRSSRLDGRSAVGRPGLPVPEYQLLQPSFQLSGPIVRDKLWYRLSHEFIYREDPVDVVTSVVIQTTSRSVNSDQLTWQVSPRNKLAFQFQYDPLSADNQGASSLRPPESAFQLELGGPQYTLTWTAPVSARWLSDSLVSYQNGRENILPSTAGVPNDCVVGIRLPFLAAAQCTNLETGRTSGSYYREWRDRRERLTVKHQTTYYGGRFLGASHQIKAGFSVENERYTRDLTRRPSMVFYIESDFNSRLGTALTTFAVPEFSSARATGTAWGIWLEDQIKPATNLTVTVGVRLDRETTESMGYLPFDPAAEALRFQREVLSLPPDKRYGATQNVFTAYEGMNDFVNLLAGTMGVAPVVVLQRISPTALQSLFWTHGRQLGNVQIVNNNAAPRLSVAWDPWGDGKTKLAVTAGRYYDKIFLAVPLVELEPITTTMELEAILSRATGEWVVEDIRSGINPAVNTQVVDRGLQTPYQTEYTVAVERELWPETSLKATYVYRSFRNQLQNVDLNHYAYDYGRCNPEPAVGRPPLIPRPDGVLDDCVGQLASPFMNIGNVQLPDGYLDTYVYNPGWGTIYEVGNYNTADYRALVLEFVRRQYRNWQMVASYAYSRAVGDAEDFNSFLGDDRTTLEAERGYLSYDQRHVAKINTTVVAPWSLRLGLTASWQTGLPYSLLRQAPTWDSVPPQYEGLGTPDPRVRVRYVTRQRNDQRNLSIWNFNVRVDKQFSFSRRGTIEIAAELFNLLNERTYTIFNPFLGYGAQINGNNEAYVRTGRQLQISFRATF